MEWSEVAQQYISPVMVGFIYNQHIMKNDIHLKLRIACLCYYGHFEHVDSKFYRLLVKSSRFLFAICVQDVIMTIKYSLLAFLLAKNFSTL